MEDLFSFYTPNYKIKKPVRLIELFAGVGSQAMSLERMGIPFENHLVVEFDKYAIESYNAVHGTDYPTMDVTKITGKDLNVRDTASYEYIMTYSFPCTDLSLAGKTMGMEEGSGTRSSLLWEVKRLLNECKELSVNDNSYGLPQILLMENVTQVHGKANVQHFRKWLDFLESLGYSNFYQDMNSKDYGVAQNRDRCFCVSILGEDVSYKFPEPVNLTCCVKDYLEPEVDEKYYIRTEASERLINNLIERGEIADHDGTFRTPTDKKEELAEPSFF